MRRPVTSSTISGSANCLSCTDQREQPAQRMQPLLGARRRRRRRLRGHRRGGRRRAPAHRAAPPRRRRRSPAARSACRRVPAVCTISVARPKCRSIGPRSMSRCCTRERGTRISLRHSWPRRTCRPVSSSFHGVTASAGSRATRRRRRTAAAARPSPQPCQPAEVENRSARPAPASRSRSPRRRRTAGPRACRRSSPAAPPLAAGLPVVHVRGQRRRGGGAAAMPASQDLSGDSLMSVAVRVVGIGFAGARRTRAEALVGPLVLPHVAAGDRLDRARSSPRSRATRSASAIVRRRGSK